MKYADFRQVTRSCTLARRICDTQSIFEAGRELLDALESEGPVRLIGIGVSRFETTPEQARLPLPGDAGCREERRVRLDRALTIRARFGNKALVRGRLFE